VSPSPLEQRRAVWERARSETVDLLVVGGGINGVGIALDAASRGLSTILVERDDLAVGTSSRSSKLIHGGLRYLEQYRFGLVREALGERTLLGRLAPHLVEMERFVFPVTGAWWKVPYMAAGLTFYDMLGGRHGGRFHHLNRDEAMTRVPSLRAERLTAAFEYSDGVFDDARLVVALARTARSLGAGVITRVEMVELEEAAAGMSHVTVSDRLTGETGRVRAWAVVDATGAFSADDEAGVAPSRGVHIVVPRDKVDASTGMTIRVPGRVVFLIPWLDRWLIGTTDVPHTGPVDRPRASADELEYLFHSVRRVLDVELGPDDIISTFAGIRPLADDGESDDTAELSREERITEVRPGLFRVRGGKYTTYRRVAERVVDKVAARLAKGGPSMTAAIPVPGAAPAAALAASAEKLVESGMEADIARRLVRRHGSEAPVLAETARSLGLDHRLVPDLPYLAVEAWWAVHEEHALGLDDVLSRRTRISLEVRDHGEAALDSVAGVLADALGWGGAERERATREFRESADHEYGVPGRGLVAGEVRP
jgi:glycerol-3-phosphate dehydrogenase